MSLLKYAQDPNIVQGNGRGQLSFHRSHLDGVPFRGPRALLREEEYDQYTEVVQDGYAKLFDTSNDEDSAKLNQIVDAMSNGWWTVYKMVEQFAPQPDGTLKVFVWCVWAEPYRELARHRVPQGLVSAPHSR